MSTQAQKMTRHDKPGLISLGLGMLLIAIGYAPIIRHAIGFGTGGSFLNVVLFTAAGLMAGLSGMMLLVRAEASNAIQGDTRLVSEHRVAALCHISALPLWLGVPLGNFMLPYLCWRRVRQQSSFVDRHGIASLNFQLSVTLYLLIAVLLFYLVAGLMMYVLVMSFHILLTFYASWRAWSGSEFTYPVSIQFIKHSAIGSRPR